MIATLERLDGAAASWLAQRDSSLVHLPEAVAATEPNWHLHDVQWAPGQGCRLAYAAPINGSDASRFVAVELDADRWFSYDFRSDQGLPGLSAVADPDFVTEQLAAVVGEPIRHLRVQPVRYRPGGRCVLRYDLQTASGLAQYYAKVFPSSIFADAAGRATRVAAAAPAQLNITRVLASWPQFGTTVSKAVQGQSVSAVLRDPAVSDHSRRHLVFRLGGLLADFHNLTGVSAPARTASDQLRDVAALLPAVRILDVARADSLRRLLDRLGRQLPRHDHREGDHREGDHREGDHREGDHREVLSHGAFRPGQVIVDEADQLHLLDLDGVCRGDAERDLGSASSYLSWQGIRPPTGRLELSGFDEALLAGYAARGRAANPASLVWWRAAGMAQIAARRFRRLEVGDWPSVARLVDLAGSLLDALPNGPLSNGSAE